MGYDTGMKRFSLSETPYAPVSHDPGLKKKVLIASGTLTGIKHLSHIVLKEGQTAVEHAHAGVSEVFYCIRGRVVFTVNGLEQHLRPGECLVVEPGQQHSIADVPEECEMLYLMS